MSTRVFIVEDSPAIYEQLVEGISALDDVEVVGTADREGPAIAALEHTMPDIALVDINLLEGTGLNVTRQIRKKLSKCQLHIVIMTNFASPMVRSQCLALGANAFIDKSSEFGRIPELIAAFRDRGANSTFRH